MPSINSAFPSSYLKAADIPKGKRVTVIIESLSFEDIGGDHKPVLHFQGKDKGVVLNKTNAASIVDITGTDDYDLWPGKAIALYATRTPYEGKMVDCIRVCEPAPGSAPAPSPAPEPAENQDIPF